MKTSSRNMTANPPQGKKNHNWLLGDENKTKIHLSIAEKPRGKGERKEIVTERKYLKLFFKYLKKVDDRTYCSAYAMHT